MKKDFFKPKSKTPDNSYDQSNQQTEKNHCCDRKIKTEISFFDTDISGKITYPMQFVMKKVDDNSYYYNDYSSQDNVFTGFGIHDAKV